jgi:hypothetical protein
MPQTAPFSASLFPGCLEYGTPYQPASGFALFSRATKGRTDLVDAILSYEVLNAATPVLIAIISFGWVMWLLERHANPKQFNGQHSGVCALRLRCVRGDARGNAAGDGFLFPCVRAPPARLTRPTLLWRCARRLCVRGHGHIRLRRCAPPARLASFLPCTFARSDTPQPAPLRSRPPTHPPTRPLQTLRP